MQLLGQAQACVCVDAAKQKAALDHPRGLFQPRGSLILLSGLHHLQSSAVDVLQWITGVLLFFPVAKLGTGRAGHRDSTRGSLGDFPFICEGVFHPCTDF